MAKEKSRMRITCVKRSKKKGVDRIEIFYEHLVNGYWNEKSDKNYQLAAPELYQAFDALSIHAAELHELPQEYAKRLTVSNVKYSYSGEEEIMGATMIVKMEMMFADKSATLATPFKKSYPEDGTAFDEAQYLTEGCVSALWELDRQARLFIDGKRAQIELWGEDTSVAAVAVETPQEPDDESIDGVAIPGMGNVINMPFVATGGGLESHASM